MPEIKKFVEKDIEDFENLGLEYGCGKTPRIDFMDKKGKKLETVEVDVMDCFQISDLLRNNGIRYVLYSLVC
jgi:hypothetical protein